MPKKTACLLFISFMFVNYVAVYSQTPNCKGQRNCSQSTNLKITEDAIHNINENEKRDIRDSSIRSSLTATDIDIYNPPLDDNPVPNATDKLFVVDNQEDLDTGCTYRDERPGRALTIRLNVTRVIDKNKDQLTEEEVQARKARGLLSDTAILTLPAWDVNESQNEIDVVYFNGHKLTNINGTERLTGESVKWRLNQFRVPLSYIKFASYTRQDNNPGRIASDENELLNSPTFGENVISISIDTGTPSSEGYGQWCTSIDWVSLKVQVMSPVIFLHGQGSDGCFFCRQGFTGELDRQGILYDNTITFPSNSIEVKGYQLQIIRKIVTALGVDSVHLVAHSKGGLDGREYMELFLPFDKKEYPFNVISLTTLSTPHNGSVAANAVDLQNRWKSTPVQGKIPFVLYLGSYNFQINDGHRSLATYNVRNFNERNIPRLYEGAQINSGEGQLTYFNAIAANADLTDNYGNLPGDKNLTTVDELKDLVNESGFSVYPEDYPPPPVYSSCPIFYWLLFPSVARDFQDETANKLYRFIGTTKSVELRNNRLPEPFNADFIEVAQPPGMSFRDNDGLVEISSGLGRMSFSSSGEGTKSFEELTRVGGHGLVFDPTTNGGRNHGNIANAGVAIQVVTWLKEADRNSIEGDLR